ncbi:MAG: hypothetical protein QOH88_1947 [Verrucomicrobiota bacterium]
MVRQKEGRNLESIFHVEWRPVVWTFAVDMGRFRSLVLQLAKEARGNAVWDAIKIGTAGVIAFAYWLVAKVAGWPREYWIQGLIFIGSLGCLVFAFSKRNRVVQVVPSKEPPFDLNNAFAIEALVVSDLQNRTERGFDKEGKPAWSLDCEVSIRNLHPIQGISDVTLRVLSVSPSMMALPSHEARTQDTTLRRVHFSFTDIPLGKPLLGDQTGHVRIFGAARRILFSESKTAVGVKFYGKWPEGLKTEFTPEAQHLLTVEVTASGVKKQEAHFHLGFSAELKDPVLTVIKLQNIADFAIRKRQSIYETVAAKLANTPAVQFAGLKCLQDARADTLEQNDELLWVCDNLVRDGYEHPFHYMDVVPQKGWLTFLREARKSGIDFEDDMATLQWVMETHP